MGVRPLGWYPRGNSVCRADGWRVGETHGQMVANSSAIPLVGRATGGLVADPEGQRIISMKAVVFPHPHEVVVEDCPNPQPGPGEVLVAVKAAGVCGTDVHLFEGDFIGSYPLIPGHEFAGEVVEVGPGVDSAAVGDLVAIQPSLLRRV